MAEVKRVAHGTHVCPWWLMYLFDHRVRALFQPTTPVIAPWVAPAPARKAEKPAMAQLVGTAVQMAQTLPASLDLATGRIRGEGPLRLVVPQSRPGAPDRGSGSQPPECGGRYPYDESADHNADPMVRGVIAIRVNPLPADVEDFDIRNGGWAYVHDARVVVYGFGVRTP